MVGVGEDVAEKADVSQKSAPCDVWLQGEHFDLAGGGRRSVSEE